MYLPILEAEPSSDPCYPLRQVFQEAMTCVVGVETGSTVLLGADSLAIERKTLSKNLQQDAKVFVTGSFAYGFVGSWRLGQLLHYGFSTPRLPTSNTEEDMMRFMCTVFVDKMRSCLSDGGCLATDNGEESIPGQVLIAVRGRLYHVEEDFYVARSIHGYDAAGSGSDLALGSLVTTARYSMSAKTRATRALEAAATYNAGVSPPFVFVEA